MSRLLLVLAGIVALIALAPLVGILFFVIDPPENPFVEPRSFSEIAASQNLYSLIGTSILLAIIVAIGAAIIGGWLAWVEVRAKYPGHGFLHLSGLLPLAMPSYVLAVTLGPAGWVGNVIGFGPLSGFWPAVMTLVIVTVPYVQLTVSAALRRISAAEEEAAKTLGASFFHRFRLCIWPKVRSAVAFSFLISFLYAISDFGAVATLDLPVLTWRLYLAIQKFEFAEAAILGLPLLLCTIPCLFLVHWVGGRRKKPRFAANPRQPQPVRLNAYALSFSYLLHALMIGVGLLIPVLTLGDWVVDGYRAGEVFVSPWKSVLVSSFLALIGAAITLALAMAPAWLSSRTRHGHWLTQLTYLSSALPGVLLAFGILGFCLRVTEHTGGYKLITSVGILLFIGYAMRFLAEAFGPLRSGIDQLDERHKESARTLGAGEKRWFFSIVMPQLRPNIAAAYLIAFVAILKELPITLILGSQTGYRTIAFRIWDRTEEAFWHDAGLHALLLLTLALAFTLLTLRWRRHA